MTIAELTQTAADLISTQNKLVRLNAKIRDQQREIKYHADQLTKIQKGFYDDMSDAAGYKAYNTPRHTEILQKTLAAQAELTKQVIGLEATRPLIASLKHSLALSCYFQGNNAQ